MSGTISANGVTIPFLVSSAREGFFSDSAIISEEELTTPGVNGARWRTVFKQFADFEFTTISQATTVTGGIIYKRQAERSLVGANATLTASIAGINYTMKKVHVKAARAVIVPGPLYGAGASNANAHVIIKWLLHGTDFDSQ